MKLRILLLTPLVFSTVLAAQEAKTIAILNPAIAKQFTGENFFCDPEAVAVMNRMHKRTFMDKTERVMAVDRTLLRVAPDDNQHLRAWVVVMHDTVAVLHTHAIDDSPRPSENDKAVARRTHMPVYVLTLSGLYVAVPDGSVRFIARYDGRRLSICGL